MKKINIAKVVLGLLLVALILGLYQFRFAEESALELVQKIDKEHSFQTKENEVKNIILLIGDGMGPQQIGLLQEYAMRAPKSIYQGKPTAFEKFAEVSTIGVSMHGPGESLVVDSACSATQLATGVVSNSEMIGLDIDGNRVETVLEKAKRLGKKTGLVSDTRITHATPAAFASHQLHRSMENKIAEEMIETATVDLLLSGGLRHFLPADYSIQTGAESSFERKLSESGISLKSKRKDRKNLLQLAVKQGYQVAFNASQLSGTEGDKVLGLFASNGLQDGIDASNKKQPEQPQLAEMTRYALTQLESEPNGFFLMVEGGQIDWAAHNNDAGTLLHEMVKFEKAVDEVFEWAKGRTDTLVIITADHETGGFGFSYSRSNLPKARELSGDQAKGQLFKPNFNFGALEILDKLYNQKLSFKEMWRLAKKGNKLPDASSLQQVINANSDFKVTTKAAESIILLEDNEYRVEGHPYLSAKKFPKINDFTPFYVYGEEIHYDLMGRALSEQQNVVWSTGTHTHTPVLLFAFGPDSAVKQFSGFQTHSQIGAKLQSLIK